MRRPARAVAVLAMAGLFVHASDPPLRVVRSIDLKRYAGKWFEIASLPDKSREQCARDVVVHFALRTDNRIDVVNRCRTAEGNLDEERGIARRVSNGRSSARLEVKFSTGPFSFLSGWSDYWIIGLGPDYTWAVVGAPNRQSLWILSRLPGMSDSGYEQALEIAKGNGFDIKSLKKIVHRDVR
jgi:apolipoprotein D and lipocalin family protein